MFFWISRSILWFTFHFFFGMKVKGKEHVPRSGGFILAPNHVSYLDPPVVGCACPRKVHYMAKRELFSVPLLGRWMRAVGTFPVKRGSADRAALHEAVNILKSGGCVCVFPEGRRVPVGKKLEGESGIMMLASMAKVPILPAAIIGTRPWHRKIFGFIPWFSKLEVRLGGLIYPELENAAANRSEVFKKAVADVMTHIEQLKIGAISV